MSQMVDDPIKVLVLQVEEAVVRYAHRSTIVGWAAAHESDELALHADEAVGRDVVKEAVKLRVVEDVSIKKDNESLNGGFSADSCVDTRLRGCRYASGGPARIHRTTHTGQPVQAGNSKEACL